MSYSCVNPLCVRHGPPGQACALVVESGPVKVIDWVPQLTGTIWFCTLRRGHPGPCESCELDLVKSRCKQNLQPGEIS